MFSDIRFLLLTSSCCNVCLCSIPAPPKVLNLKIIGDMRENSKVTASGVVTGGTEGSSRVQWFKTSFSTLVGEKGLEALSTSKIAKVCDPIFFLCGFSNLQSKGFCFYFGNKCIVNYHLLFPFFRHFAYHWELLVITLLQNSLL